jgi:LPS-assembly protein
MRSWGKLLVAGVGLSLLALPAVVPADEVPPSTETSTNKGEAATIDARELNFDRSTSMAYAKGDVVIHYQDAVLRADKVRYNTATRDVWAEGNVRLNRQGQEWVTPALYYNFDTHAMKADEVRGFFDPVFITATQVTLVTTNHYTAPKATITTCDYDPPDFHIQASHAEIYPGDRVVGFNTSVWFGSVPVFWMPVTVWSLKDENPPVSLTFGHNSRWGAYVQTTTSWRLNPNLLLAAHIDEYTNRGVGSGPDLTYEFGKDIHGQLRGYYINDADARDSNDPNAGKGLPQNRWLGEWQHKEYFPGDVTLTIDANKQSDRDIVNDFFNADYRRDSEPATTFDVTKHGDNYAISALARPQFNSFYDEVERLPEVKLSVNRTRLGPTPLYYESESSVGYYNNYAASSNAVPFDPLFSGSTLRVDTFHQIVSPQMLFGWLSVVPRAGGRYTYYERAPDSASDNNNVSRYVAELGSEVSFKLTRTWTDAQNKWLGVDGLRHIVQPFADYQWIPTPNVKSNELFQFDTVRSIILSNGQSLVVTRYLPLEMPAYNLTDAIGLEDTVRFGLRQRLQTRRDGQPWDLVELTGWTDYHIERISGQSDFSDLFGTLNIRPREWVAINTFTRYDFQTGILQELNTETRFGDLDQWSVGVGTRYLDGDSNQVTIDTAWRLGRTWVAHVYERFDMQDGQWEEQDYSLRQETHDWYITYGFRYQSQRSNSDNATGYIAVTLKAFPGVRLGFN